MKALTIAVKKIRCFDEVLLLTNQRVIYWEKENALILSDLHIGKSAHFQKSGIPVPSSILLSDLSRLDKLIRHFKVEKLIVVGDLFHASYNKDLDIFKEWLTNYKNLTIKLIKGNHDRLKNSIYDRFKIETFTKELKINSFKFVHEFSCKQTNSYTISGHIHPGVFIKGKGKQCIKLPCYQVTENRLVLPAFSLFTGLNTRDTPKNYKNIAFTENAIFEL